MTNPTAAGAFDLEGAWAEAVRELDREVAAARALLTEQRLTVCLAGAVGSGRPALLAALQGDTGGGSAAAGLPGEPEELVFWSPPARPEVRFALPPAFQDPAPERRAQVERFVRAEADVLIFAFNANAGVTRQDQAALDAFRAGGKPFLVVFAKIDTLRPADRGVVLADAAARLGLGDEAPLGVAAATGEGIGELQDRLRGLLDGRGKAILLDRGRRARAGEAERVTAEALAAAAAGDSFAAAMTVCVRAAVRLACLGGREERLGRLAEVLRAALASPRTRELAAARLDTGKPEDAAAERAHRVLLAAFAGAILRTAAALFAEEQEPATERLRAVFAGALIERRLALALGGGEGGGGAAVGAGRAFELLAESLRSGELAPARLAAVLPGVKSEFAAWRTGRIDDAEYARRVGALVRGEGVPSVPAASAAPAAPAEPAAAAPGPIARAFQKVAGAPGDLVENLWETRLRPRFSEWTEEQKALLSVDLLKLRAELEADIDRKYGELLKKTRQEAEDFMTRTVETINRQAEEAERRARHRLWVSSLFILGWALVGLAYALVRRWAGA
ncbi:MAG: hypothetical protein HZA54_19440 [Planctomycetes bacterium]|nr:hypothetical protein [Planctomycetota bacterium]